MNWDEVGAIGQGLGAGSGIHHAGVSVDLDAPCKIRVAAAWLARLNLLVYVNPDCAIPELRETHFG